MQRSTENSSRENINQTKEKEEDKAQKMNVNPNPRANENVKNVPFEKEKKETGVGSEITDGEAG
ncbi:MAG: hypothetical protein ABR503_00460 [Chitinophagaceae bacterium]